MRVEIELHEEMPTGLKQIIEDTARLSADPQDLCRSIVQIALVCARQMSPEQRKLFGDFLRQESSWISLREQ
jgi:hypothetical protein